jgi:hypothetical protein
MTDVFFTLCSSQHAATKRVPMKNRRLTIGSDDACALVVKDDGFAPIHASIHLEDERIWIVEEQASGDGYVNNERIAVTGTLLRNGDQISLGQHTIIGVEMRGSPARLKPVRTKPERAQTRARRDSSNPSPVMIAGGLLFLASVLVLTGIGARAWTFRARHEEQAGSRAGREEAGGVARAQPTGLTPVEGATPNLTTSPVSGPVVNQVEPEAASPSQTLPQASQSDATAAHHAPVEGQTTQAAPRKLYMQMSEQERIEYVEQQAQHIALKIGNRPYAFTPEVVLLIKRDVDGYSKRVGNKSTALWSEDLRFMFARARTQYAPHIIRAFNARGIPPVVGLYLVVIETEYHNIRSENSAGAAGLFQFIPKTASGYGVNPAQRTDISKMAPAAAKYMQDRIAEFGTDSMSVALAIAGYNRSPASVRRDLKEVLNSENKERSFWTLIANSKKLDHWFQGENIKYVPKFFAAAIIGEHPSDFGLEMRPLSSYTEITDAPTGDAPPEP